MAKFVKTVSKGSRFNQIYIPKSMEHLIEVGDEVEVRLVRKRAQLFYSAGLGKLSEFKEKLIKDAFSFLEGFDGVTSVFAVGSFLTEKISYNDIDLILITSKNDQHFEQQVYSRLVDKFNLKFHVISIEDSRFEHLLKICPLTKSMFSSFVCSSRIEIPDKREIDISHLKFLLMMPYDLLEIKLSSRAFYDSLRRLVTVERFLKGKTLYASGINSELMKLMNIKLLNKMRDNEEVEEKSVAVVRRMLRERLNAIEGLMKDGQE